MCQGVRSPKERKNKEATVTRRY
ncbi:rCG51950 [Rattus norvegicus]|uniref:RCG51950 n=1 Tax=Rattus norvegicus TaxID=10116 RepID=A6K317_RAT|nr:rCG51950 [Rattus norvegicus]